MSIAYFWTYAFLSLVIYAFSIDIKSLDSQVHFDADLIATSPYAEIKTCHKEFDRQGYQLYHIKFFEVGKNKRHTYDRFAHKYNKIANILVTMGTVPNVDSIVHTGTQMNFISKKRLWQFSRIVIYYCLKKQCKKLSQQFAKYEPIYLKQRDRLVIGPLNEKLQALEAYRAAREQTLAFLDSSSDQQNIFVIDGVVSFKILNKGSRNQEDGDNQIKETTNPKGQKDRQERDKRKGYTDRDEDITVKTVFRIKLKTNVNSGQNLSQDLIDGKQPSSEQQQKSLSEEQQQEGRVSQADDETLANNQDDEGVYWDQL